LEKKNSLFVELQQLTLFFKRFLEACEENLLFWMDVEMFKNISSNDSRFMERVNEIIQRYLVRGADYPVNVDAESIVELNQNLNKGEISKDIFDALQHEVYTLMLNDSFSKFKKSQEYLNYCTNKKSSSEVIETDSSELVPPPPPRRRRRIISLFSRLSTLKPFRRSPKTSTLQATPPKSSIIATQSCVFDGSLSMTESSLQSYSSFYDEPVEIEQLNSNRSTGTSSMNSKQSFLTQSFGSLSRFRLFKKGVMSQPKPIMKNQLQTITTADLVFERYFNGIMVN
jgi:hypothetical protein